MWFSKTRLGDIVKYLIQLNQTNDISGLYQSLVLHKIHQDNLLWSRVQILTAIQVGILGGGFALHFAWEYSVLAGSILVGGGLLTLFMFFLVLGDYADMKVNDAIMNDLAKRLLPSGIKGAVRWTDDMVWHRRFKFWHIRFPPGHYMIYGGIIIILLADFVSGVCILCGLLVFV